MKVISKCCSSLKPAKKSMFLIPKGTKLNFLKFKMLSAPQIWFHYKHCTGGNATDV